MKTKQKNRILVLLSILFSISLNAQTEKHPVFNEPPLPVNFVVTNNKGISHPAIPDSLAGLIVLKINRTVFPPDVNPKDFLAPSWGVDCDNQEIIVLAQEITSLCKDDYSKAKAIHDWLATHIYYDFDAYYANNGANSYNYVVGSVDVLHNKRSVCSGYANLWAALLRSAGIPCRVVSGVGLGLSTNGEWNFQNLEKTTNHAWNEIYVSGKWIIMDATWDSDMRYQHGTFDRGCGLRGYRYFDPTIENFSLDHRLDAENSEGRQRVENIKEDCIWNYLANRNTLESYQFYMQIYPSGRYSDKCRTGIDRRLNSVYGKLRTQKTP